MEISPEQWGKLKEMFRTAIEYEPQQRAAFLDQVCLDSPDLRREIESLLASHDGAANFIETPVFAENVKALVEPRSESVEGQRVGHYQLIREIGRGGMGMVYLAERADDQYQQLVAIKVVRRGMDTDDIVRRFRNERQILAALEHPNIARLLDGGTTEDGRPYLVMEFVEGTPVTDYCDNHRLTTNERLELFRTICAAVQHAHQNLVVHRDLKPSNILITPDGTVKLLDFGIAKVLNPELSALESELTRTEMRVLTPDYASPEQVRGEKLTTAADVYSLGIVLYELLTGHRPYRSTRTPPHEFARLICEREPTRPSTAVNQIEVVTHGESKPQTTITPEFVSRARDTQPDKLRRRLSGDLDNIVLMALRKEPRRRYESAAQFAADIERHLNGLPVIARKDTFAYRTSKFVGRHRVGVAAAAAVLLALLAGLAATVWQARVASRERDQARAEQVKAEQLNKFLQSMLSAASPEEKGREAKVIEVMEDAAARIETEFAGQPELKAQALLTIGQTYDQIGLVNQAEAPLREALRLNLSLYGENNQATALSMIYLSTPLMNKSNFVEAESLLSKAVAIERRLSPSGSKDLALALFVLGELYVRKIEFEKAKPLLQESVSISDKISGENNEDSATTLISLGRAQHFSGDLAGAETTYRKSIVIFRGLPQRYETRLAMVLLNLGRLLTEKGSYDEGINAIREGESIYQKQGETFFLFEAKAYLCRAFANRGDDEQVTTEGVKTIEMGRRLDLESAPDFISTLRFLGLGLTHTGRAKEAEPYLREALDRSAKSSTNHEVFYALAQGALGECLTAQKRYNEAEPLLVASYEVLKKSPPPNSPQIKSALQRLVTLYENWGKHDAANQYRNSL
jgi:serine/threonine-protein kinase